MESKQIQSAVQSMQNSQLYLQQKLKLGQSSQINIFKQSTLVQFTLPFSAVQVMHMPSVKQSSEYNLNSPVMQSAQKKWPILQSMQIKSGPQWIEMQSIQIRADVDSLQIPPLSQN